ncbi:MAG: hypothetical protein ACFNUG_08995 [Tannerella forsythia]|jgi:hypothetical protein|uniref:hypothetical protein n=1 Tax=Tannerella forsythia TaxID=28112 RepID=UPI00360848FF
MFSRKSILIVQLLFICLLVYGQEKRTWSIGIHYQGVSDGKKELQYPEGISVDYETRRERLALEALYGLTERFKLKTSLGVSFYNSDASFAAARAKNKSGASISEPLLSIGQMASYDIIQWDIIPSARLNIAPFVELEYSMSLRNRNKTVGFDDLQSQEAKDFSTTYNVPAISAQTKMPSGILSLSGGLSAECVLMKKVGIFYNIGYGLPLVGHSTIHVDMLYQSKIIKAEELKSRDRGIMQAIGARFYF